MNRITLILATVLSLAFTQVTAQDFNKGAKAAQAGDFTTTLNEPSRFPPQAHIYVRSKLPWVELSGVIPVFEEFYRREDIYTHEGLKRLDSLKP